MISYPAGVCIHEFRARIQNALSIVPKATRKVDPRWIISPTAAVAEQHHAEKARFQKEGGQHFIAEQRTGDIADALHVARPVGAELKTHGDAADDARARMSGRRSWSKAGRRAANPASAAGRSRSQVLQPEKQQNPAQRDRNRGKQNMERDVGGKLDARKERTTSIRISSRFGAAPGRQSALHNGQTRTSIPLAT